MASSDTEQDPPIVIKKYANRRLYNTQTSSYVTLELLCHMVKDGVEFEVRDAKTGVDITHSVLTQIIVEEESKGANLLPIPFLRQLIGFYGDRLETLVPSFLEMSMESFSSNQDKMRQQMTSAFDPETAFKQFESIAKQNLSMFEQSMRMFSPLENTGGAPEAEPGSAPEPENEPANDEISILKNQLSGMQAQLDALARKKP